MVSDKTLRQYVLEEHVPYLAFLSIEIELFVNLLNSRKLIQEKENVENIEEKEE